MKARVKATGEIVEVHTHDDADFQDRQGRFYWEQELYFGSLDARYDEPDYWTRLEHQAAIAAMQGILACEEWKISPREGVSFAGEVALQAQKIAHALVEKMKNNTNK